MRTESNEFFKYENNFKKFAHIKSKLVLGDLNYNENPRVTIAIPTYKRPDLLKQAIDSAINQNDFSDYEIIVVDNDSDSIIYESETEKLIKSYDDPKILYYKNEDNLGIYGNWNRCLELARGKWYIMLHDDDILLNDFLKETLYILSRNPKISCIKVRHFILDERNNAEKNTFKEKLKNFRRKIWRYSELDFLVENPIGGPVGIVIDREKAILAGGFNETYYPSSDYVFFTKYCMDNNIYYYNKVLCMWRVSKNESLSKGVLINSTKIHYNMINILREKNIIRNIFFKKYSLYFSLNALKEIKSFWKFEFEEEDVDFLTNNAKLNPFINLFYTMFKNIWSFRRFIF